MQEDIEHRAVTLAINAGKIARAHVPRCACEAASFFEKQASAAQASEATGKTVGEKAHWAEPRRDPRQTCPMTMM